MENGVKGTNLFFPIEGEREKEHFGTLNNIPDSWEKQNDILLCVTIGRHQSLYQFSEKKCEWVTERHKKCKDEEKVAKKNLGKTVTIREY